MAEFNKNNFYQWFGNDTRKGLTREREIELFTKLKNPRLSKLKKEIVKDEIFQNYYRLVFSMCAKVVNSDSVLKEKNIDDLISWAVMGLMTAIDKFDLSRGFRFSTHATWWIKSRITRHEYENLVIRIPDSVVTDLRVVIRHLDSFKQKYGVHGLSYSNETKFYKYIKKHEKSILDLTILRLRRAITAYKRTLVSSYDQKTIQNTNSTFQSDLFAINSIKLGNNVNSVENKSVDNIYREEMLKKIVVIINTHLTTLESNLLKRAHGLDDYNVMTTLEIAEEFALTHKYIQTICNRARNKLIVIIKTRYNEVFKDMGAVLNDF